MGEERRREAPPYPDWTREANKQGLRKWNVHVQPPYAETRRVIRYSGAYLKRGPLSEKRVTSYDGRTVRIAHRHPEEHEADYYELTGEECVRRLLLHMPEPRLHTSRSYGLYHPAARKLLATARAQIRQIPVPDDSSAEATRQPACRVPSTPPVCPECGRPLRVCVRIHGGQSPPASYRQQQRRRAA